MASKSFALTTAGTGGGSPLYLSEDLGTTWISISPTGLSFADLSQGSVCDVAVGPYNPNEVLITGPAGIRRSVDGGLNFAAASTFPGKYLTYKDSNSLASISDSQIAASNNSGGTWTTLAATPATLFPSAVDPKFGAIYFSNFNSGFVVVNGLTATAEKISTIWRTANAGTNWIISIEITGLSHIVSIHGNDEEGLLLFLTEDSGLYRLDYDLIEDPVLIDDTIIGGVGGELRQIGENPNKIYLITDGLNTQNIYYSDDGGYSFTLKSTGLFGQTTYPRIFAFSDSVIIMLTSIVAGSEAAIYKSEDGGVTLTNQFLDGDGRAIALDSSTALNCGECPEGFTFKEGSNDCEQITYGGPLCNPPYFYDVITNGCALTDSSTAVNISLAIDVSGSVIPEEREQYVIFLKLFIDELLERLATNNTQMAISLWNSTACLQQDWTNDPILLKNAIDTVTGDNPVNSNCPGFNALSGGTCHAKALETAVRVLHQGALDRPAAANFLINVTDGTSVCGPCDLTDLGYTITLPPLDQGLDTNDCLFLKLVQQIKQNLAGKPATFMMLAVGNSGERQNLETKFKNKSCEGVPVPFPSANEDGDLFFYNAGDFSEANDFAKQLVIGLGAQIIPSASNCPSGCTPVPGDDSRGYCRCVDTVDFIPCSYRLVDCLDDTITKITDADLQSYYDNNEIITIQGQTNCWKIEQLTSIEPNPEQVIVDEVFPTCNECALAFALINCKDPNVVIYTIQESFLPYVDPDKTVMLEEYPSECWTVTRNTASQYTPQTLTVKGTIYDDCPTCLGARSYLTSCSNNQSVIVTRTDVSQYLNETVSIKGFPDACFTVLQEACDCIKVRFRTLSDGTRTYILPAHPVKINGRNQYTIVTKTNKRYLIAYDTTEPRWEVWNIDTNTLVSYTPIDAECPYIGYWENISAETMYGIEPCADAIYEVEIDGTYISCECCINKNC